MILSNQFLIRIRICCFLSRGIKRKDLSNVIFNYLLLRLIYLLFLQHLCKIISYFYNIYVTFT